MAERKKPVIGVMPLYDDDKESIWMLPGYMNGISENGGIPIILPMNISKEDLDEILDGFDGFLFTGGHDISPSLYGEEVSSKCGETNQDRDLLEKRVFEYAYAQDKPVLGICRGIQIINALMGGSLYQDIPSELICDKKVEHHMTPPYDRTVHDVVIVKNSPLNRLWNKDIKSVNSYHHQGIKTLGNNLEAMAYSEDGLIEAVYAENKKFIWGVQWHPEFIFKKDEEQKNIFAYFIKAMS